VSPARPHSRRDHGAASLRVRAPPHRARTSPLGTPSALGTGRRADAGVLFDDVTESRLNVDVRGIGGGKTPLSPGIVGDSITFGHPGEADGTRNSSVEVNVLLARGNINFAFNDDIGLGHFEEDDAPGDPTAFGPSQMNVSIAGNGRRQDVDNVRLLASGVVDTASTLNFSASVGAGDGSFTGLIDAGRVRIANDAGGSTGGAAQSNVQAVLGDDATPFKSINQHHAIELPGLFDVNVRGGSGTDTVKFDLGGSGFTDAGAPVRFGSLAGHGPTAALRASVRRHRRTFRGLPPAV
jgi:hypothetical protein